MSEAWWDRRFRLSIRKSEQNSDLPSRLKGGRGQDCPPHNFPHVHRDIMQA